MKTNTLEFIHVFFTILFCFLAAIYFNNTYLSVIVVLKSAFLLIVTINKNAQNVS